jgi:GntR family transcriptional regulator/MocR family aminotransferase
MTRVASGRTLNVLLTPSAAVPLYRQIYAAIRDGILRERLRPGAPLPSTRAMATDLAVSRSTVVLAYEQLRAEGYLTSRRGGATRVADAIPERLLRSAASPTPHAPPHAPQRAPRPLPISAVEMRDGYGLRHALLAQSRPPRAGRARGARG